MRLRKILLKILLAILLIIVLVIVGLFLYNKLNHINITNEDIVKIEYSYGGGYGTEIYTATKTITFTNDGKVLLTNSYDLSKKELDIGVDKYNELVQYVNDRNAVFKEKIFESKNVMDGGSSHISITLKDGTTYKVGGYMVSNKKYKEIKEKINELIDRNELNEYINNIGISKEEITEVEYSYGGGYGDEIDAASKVITFKNNGIVIFSNSYNSFTKEFEIGVDKYDELVKFINERITIFNEHADEDKEVLDGSSSTLKITLKDGTIYKTGGYMITNEDYNAIKNKIYELIDNDSFNEYVEDIRK